MATPRDELDSTATETRLTTENSSKPVPRDQRARSRPWVIAAALAVMALVAGVAWWVADATVSTGDYDRVVAELEATEEQLGQTRLALGELQTDLEAASQDLEASNLVLQESEYDLAVIEAGLRHVDRAFQFEALLTEQGFAGLDLDEGEFLGPDAEMNLIERFDVPFEVGALRGHVIFVELEELAGGGFGIEMFFEEGLSAPESEAWIDAAARSMVRMREPALAEDEVVDLATDLTASNEYYEAVGQTIFITHGGITDPPMWVFGAEAMDFTYSDRFDGMTPSVVDPDTVSLTPVEWAMLTPDWGAAIIVEVSELAPWDVEDLGASLIWEGTTIRLCNDRLQPEDCTSGPYIRIRKAGDGYLHIGDVLAFDERPELEETVAIHGPPISACIDVTAGGSLHQYCAPLTVADD